MVVSAVARCGATAASRSGAVWRCRLVTPSAGGAYRQGDCSPLPVHFRPSTSAQQQHLRSFATSASSSSSSSSAPKQSEKQLDADSVAARAVAVSMHRLLVRSLYRIKDEDELPASSNFELGGLLRTIASRYGVNTDFKITESNKRWIAQALACRNPFSDVQHGYELTILTPERQGGKYHLVEDNGDYLNTKPVMLSYDTLMLQDRTYIRCTGADEAESINAEDPQFCNLRALIRQLLAKKLQVEVDPAEAGEHSGPVSFKREAVLDLGFELLELIAEFRRSSRFVARQKRLQKRQIDREFEVLSHKRAPKNRARMRQAKERIKELWLNHPDREIRDRLFSVCNLVGDLDFLTTTPRRGKAVEDLESSAKIDDATKRQCLLELDDILSVDPLHVETLHTRALLFFMDGNYPACEEDLKQILKIERRHFPSLQTLFRLHQVREDRKGMIDVVDDLRAIAPRDPDLDNLYRDIPNASENPPVAKSTRSSPRVNDTETGPVAGTSAKSKTRASSATAKTDIEELFDDDSAAEQFNANTRNNAVSSSSAPAEGDAPSAAAGPASRATANNPTSKKVPVDAEGRVD
ncbi:unnamed protein product [Amoebophrya sp. A120]|nr:unnamed protein product [Amoebophrya sp. A120]|eukprot:GSA120T00018937001.1